MLGKIAHEPAAVDLAEQRRGLAQRHGAGAEGFEHQPVAREFGGARHQPLDVGFVELDDVGDQQKLPRHAGLFDGGLEPLIDDALMRGVLIDDNKPIARLRDDVSVVNLCSRGAERMIELIRVRFCEPSSLREAVGQIAAHVCNRTASVESGLCRLGKAAIAPPHLPRLRGRDWAGADAHRMAAPANAANPNYAAAHPPPSGRLQWWRSRRSSPPASLRDGVRS